MTYTGGCFDLAHHEVRDMKWVKAKATKTFKKKFIGGQKRKIMIFLGVFGWRL